MSYLRPLLFGTTTSVSVIASIRLLCRLGNLSLGERAQTYNVLLTTLAVTDLALGLIFSVNLLLSAGLVAGSATFCVALGYVFHFARFLSIILEVQLACALAVVARWGAKMLLKTTGCMFFCCLVLTMLLCYTSAFYAQYTWNLKEKQCLLTAPDNVFLAVVSSSMVVCVVAFCVMARSTWKFSELRRQVVMTPALYLLAFLAAYLPIIVVDSSVGHYGVSYSVAVGLESLKGFWNALTYGVVAHQVSRVCSTEFDFTVVVRDPLVAAMEYGRVSSSLGSLRTAGSSVHPSSMSVTMTSLSNHFTSVSEVSQDSTWNSSAHGGVNNDL
eukprot:CAMPEP_0194489458 /NCGR_PEP_ID=MMETSP0253-20130528/8990_1 /TAXON_ID=2966 /ORGANISM="Noctiluca scintillans" /LENGTH=327 /DNA_ID=CAMNT_0039329923 /DNA_START=71 /DNA_END=1050 /DNA_ORIENTATION=-